MDAPATVVWVAPGAPDAEQARSLASWSHAHGVRLAPPEKGEAPRLVVDLRLADAVEARLDQARDEIGARNGDGADRWLAGAESLLRAHPELPQAAWLMAEVERGRATRWRRVPPGDRQAADRAWQRAEAIDGGRVAGVGEDEPDVHPAPAAIEVDLSPENAEPWLDGRPAAPGVIATRAGLHALVVTRGGTPVWSDWIEAPPGPSAIHVVAPTAAPCSTADFAAAVSTGLTADGPRPRDVQCPTWVAAQPGAVAGSVRIALCEEGRCGPWLQWAGAPAWTWSPPVEPETKGRWPAWATWSLVAGATAAIAAGVTVAATGLLQTPPSQTRFVLGGIESH